MAIKPKVPPTKVPIIGQKDKAQSEEFVRQIMSYLDPILQQILTSVDTLERRVVVVEEVKQVFPAKVEVVIKKEEKEYDYDSHTIHAFDKILAIEERLGKLERPGK